MIFPTQELQEQIREQIREQTREKTREPFSKNIQIEMVLHDFCLCHLCFHNSVEFQQLHEDSEFQIQLDTVSFD